MKIIFEHENQKFTVEDDEVVTIHDCMRLVYQALMGIGFHPESVKDGFEALNEEINPYDVPTTED